jgi:hypothetical protein
MDEICAWWFRGRDLFGQIMRVAAPALWSSSEFG